jgi:tetratricopeptide (TPR) repeat protein
MATSNTNNHTPQTQGRMPFLSLEIIDATVAILLIIIAVMVGLLGLGLTDYGLNADATMLDVQRYSVQLGATQATGQLQADFAYADAYRAWLQADIASQVADSFDNPALADAYARLMDERLLSLSPVLSAPYFDPNTDDMPDFARYEAEIYVRDTAFASQQLKRAQNIKAFWDDKYDNMLALQISLGLVAVVLGLAETLVSHRRIRLLIIIFSTVVMAYTGVQAGIITSQPLTTLTDETLAFYADGVGLAYQSRSDEAINAFDEAITQASADNVTYVDSLIERGFTHNDIYFTLEDGEARSQALNNVLADFKAVLDAGRIDTDVVAQLNALYYQTGDLERASAMAELARANDNATIHRFDQARNWLAQGQIERAQNGYAEAIQVSANAVAQAQANGQAVDPSIWYALTVGFSEIELIADCLRDDFYCYDLPPLDALSQQEGALDVVTGLSVQVKNALTQLETQGVLDATLISTPQALLFESDDIIEESDGVTYLAYEAPTVDVLFPFEDLQAGQMLLLKVFYDGAEYYPMRQTVLWNDERLARAQANDAGMFTIPVGGDAGLYEVQFYVDGLLQGEGDFWLEEPGDE